MVFNVNLPRKILIAAAVIITSVFSVSAEPEIKTNLNISWETGDIIITAASLIPDNASNLTTERLRISESIDQNLTGIVIEAFDAVNLDSLYTLSGYLSENAERMALFDSLNDLSRRVSSSLSKDLTSVTNVYKYNIYNDLMPVLIGHRNPAPVPEVLTYIPSASFSGIVIYAADDLPLYGEEGTATLRPSVFPKIFDENMDLVASPGMSEPEFLQQWGFAVYTENLDESAFYERIGRYPFRTTAQKIFGNNHTDLLITEEAAEKILYNKANHRLIREGRILIIVKSD